MLSILNSIGQSGILQIGLPAFLILYIVYSYTFNHLSEIPGPHITRISNFWKIYAGLRGEFGKRNIALHRKYGPVVRTGPNTISVDDPAAVPIIYGFRRVFNKSVFYSLAESWHHGKPLPTMITTPDEAYHSQLARATSNGFSMTSAIQMEDQLQPLIDLFLKQLSTVGLNGQKALDATTWLKYYAFDATGCINVSEDLGFTRTGTDVGGLIDFIAVLNSYLSVIGQAPWVHRYLIGNRFVQLFMEPNNHIQNLAISMIKKRLHAEKPSTGKDLLTRFSEVSEKDPSKLNHAQLVAITTTNLLAGYAAVAISLSSILYHVSRNPDVYLKLQSEVDKAFESGELSQPPRYTEISKLKYLDAVIVEGLRIHPVTGTVLEREVPAGGVELGGKRIPAGTIVGINSWVMCANEEAFGSDAHVFRPERWLEADEEKLRLMKRSHMAHGSGPRICQGRHIGQVEIAKFLPSFIRQFDFKLAHPEKEWKILGHWFTHPSDMDMFFIPRKHEV